jgi:hypothetical protein
MTGEREGGNQVTLPLVVRLDSTLVPHPGGSGTCSEAGDIPA